MKVILGPMGTGKTVFVRKHLLGLPGSCLSTLDPKKYFFNGEEIIDTPAIENYKNIQNLLDIIANISTFKISHLVFFYKNANHNKLLSDLISISQKQDINLCICNVSNEDISYGNLPRNIKTFISFQSLKKYLASNLVVDQKEIINDTEINLDDEIAIKEEEVNVSSLEEVNITSLEVDEDKQKEAESNYKLATKAKRIIFLGPTNAGKSTLINSIKNASIFTVSAERHTTRENVSCSAVLNGQNYELFDSVGLENATKTKLNYLKGLISTMDYCYIVSAADDFTGKITCYIASFLENCNKSFNVIINKSDLIEYEDRRSIMSYLKFRLRFNSPIFTNRDKNDVTLNICHLKEDFSANVNKITEAVKARIPAVLYIKQNKSSKFYHFVIYTKEGKRINLQVIRNIINKHINTYNYHVKLEVFRYAKDKKRKFFSKESKRPFEENK